MFTKAQLESSRLQIRRTHDLSVVQLLKNHQCVVHGTLEKHIIHRNGITIHNNYWIFVSLTKLCNCIQLLRGYQTASM